jgi:hypothetical protein
MTTLQNKIDFAIVFSVKHANPNGDPLNGNRPRTDYGGFGEMTDVCIKRKIRIGCWKPEAPSSSSQTTARRMAKPVSRTAPSPKRTD